MNDNPLQQYFRRPMIHLALPTKGEFYEEGALDMPVTGELPVFPMTAIDEITYKTPDALFNGSAVVDVIKSCVPAIKNPWVMPVPDLIAVLAAIRIASFGHNMDIKTQCPKCGDESEYVLDLRTILDQIKYPDYNGSLEIGDLRITFKPMFYVDLNENNRLQFEEKRVSAIVNNAEIDQSEQIRLLSEAFKKVANYTVSTLAKNIKTITTPETSTDDQEFILDFLRNCDNTIFRRIKKEVITQKATETLEPLHVTCQNKECKHKYDQPFTLDMTSFFEQNS